ncbi:unnamed protein product [Closterium sp. Naga37s-1]|nr:unnamed protein product [Closterium sp. Naga37s-1]
MAPSPLAMAPRDLPPLTAAPLGGSGGGWRGSAAPGPPPFSYLPLLREQQRGGGDLQHLPPLPPPPPHPSPISPCCGCSGGGEGICHPPAADAAVGGGDLQHLPPPPPPPPAPPSPPSLCCKCSSGGGYGGGGCGQPAVARAAPAPPHPPPPPPLSPPSPCCGCGGGGEGICSSSPPPLLLRPSAAGAAVGEGMGVPGVATCCRPSGSCTAPSPTSPLLRVQQWGGGDLGGG